MFANSGDTDVYTNVDEIDEWPRNALMTARDSPASSIWTAIECLTKSRRLDFYRHTTATHMLEAGVPLMAIKNFLGHASVRTTERYAELTQVIVNNYIRDWNSKWFPQTINIHDDLKENPLPEYLR